MGLRRRDDEALPVAAEARPQHVSRPEVARYSARLLVFERAMGVKRLVFLVASLCLCVSPAQARDRVIAHDATIRSIYALGGDLVYSRGADGAWMRWVGGKLTKASGIPRDGGASAIGRDAKGRTVLTFALSGKWYVYDLASDRARPLGGL